MIKNVIKENWKEIIIFLIGFVIVFGFATYKLTETPPTWMDEGIYLQVARNMALNSEHGVQVAPEEFVGGSYITTGYPVTFPVSVMFMIFGTDILAARVMMVFFILILYCAVFFLVRPRDGSKNSLWFLLITLLLLATFAPMYGHGKNVLGEVPGITYFVLSLLFVKIVSEGKRTYFNYVICGLFLGLAIATKPIYILIAPAALVSFFLYRKKLFDSWVDVAMLGVGVLLPLVAWIFVQFRGDMLMDILKLYGNPNDSDPWASIVPNIKRFFTEAQPLYTLLLFGTWTIAGVWRYVKRKAIPVYELLAWIFSALILLAFLRTIGFYRYFFPAEIIALIFVIPSVKEIFEQKYHKVLLVAFMVLLCFQLYQTLFKSWVAVHDEGQRSALLRKHVGVLTHEKVFFFQAPETVNFLPESNNNYYQFFRINNLVSIGVVQLFTFPAINPDVVVAGRDAEKNPLFARYTKKETFDRYVIFRK